MQLNGRQPEQNIEIKVPELNLLYKTRTDQKGIAKVEFHRTLNSGLLESEALSGNYKKRTRFCFNTIVFRSIEVQGNKVLLNKKPIFLKAVNIHEENPYKGARALQKMMLSYY